MGTDGTQGIGRLLLIAGLFLAAAGLLLLVGGKLGLGRLPGDFTWKSDRVTFHFPLATSLLLSVLLTLALWLVASLRR